uniref:F-box/LRR-repeat protein 15-like leucin rich repeat domain-containing protein n=1 Tax=Romanomermis culicivorax TaxID=13658 RepID=A0A915INM8_ROMCU
MLNTVGLYFSVTYKFNILISNIMKTLFNICLSFISKNMQILGDDLNCLPDQCKSLLFEWFVSHDYLNSDKIRSIMTEGKFVGNLKQLTFYLSDQITDDFLKTLSTKVNRNLSKISIIYCDKVGDRGVRAITEFQTRLVKLELKGLNSVTSFGIAGVVSDHLNVVDFSDCPNICSSGIVHMVNHNPNIQNMFLNNCKAIDDLGLYAIGAHLGKNLKSLELDFLADHLRDPQAAIAYLTERCPNIMQMSLCRYFSPFSASSHFFDLECTINSNELRELDLHGNFFTVLPRLPKNISSLRLSCTGNENVHDLVQRLKNMPHL